MTNSVTYFRELFNKAIYAGGRDLMFNVRMDKPEFGLHVKNSRNQVSFLDMENPFEFKKHLKAIIEKHSRPNERAMYVNEKGEYLFNKIIFNMRFSTPEVQNLFGHGFNLTLTLNDRARVITGSITIKHTEAEWAVYEQQCQTELAQAREAMKDGQLFAAH
ncbi:hypothetical protein GCM10011607_12370 [Shewanella inventionis]|uniref:Uncharacterized protein n=1 Tax=Shewanella inventionis TaxID=1738770 RepID=A0ABQ1IVH5_9GAMM|nr:hypothetical protein [Shewanella inventionis]GGB53342.1 hypothetical protein GCM10011607_12370 [Shewanella inventionis]